LNEAVNGELVVSYPERGTCRTMSSKPPRRRHCQRSENGLGFIFELEGVVTLTSPPSHGPLETVIGDPPPKIVPPTRLNPNPSPGLAFLALLTAVTNSASRPVSELTQRNERLRLGAMTRGSLGYTYD